MNKTEVYFSDLVGAVQAMRDTAIGIDVEGGVATVCIVPKEGTVVGFLSYTGIVGDFLVPADEPGMPPYNCGGIAAMKFWKSMRTHQPSGSDVDILEGESPYSGNDVVEHGLGWIHATFSGGTEAQDTIISSAGTRYLVKVLDGLLPTS